MIFFLIGQKTAGERLLHFWIEYPCLMVLSKKILPNKTLYKVFRNRLVSASYGMYPIQKVIGPKEGGFYLCKSYSILFFDLVESYLPCDFSHLFD